ncbi:CDP-diacylglycerol--glycerol-3-phosphate 3-phosphatidyltransferase PgsA [Thermoclostridium stercorarium subsp. stercorarium DSM 8532]|jgi:cardiolipin synthase|uniref:Phosphatidylglycerophosphate synthase n=3 Tax=Thermoclostridium stercorarium TaxID=1510 RepID=L7VPW1_THES1|nr:CDP-alcohol phosphatidyltransferase family protein [Thermoclostridium stercorarium]AGC68476.1 CDP-diacylglycerol--glycerol-3-phosphate 3-phosphatidyltransferase PgsA [Thermoclostridium stercorarium subsp. stercorarium DSM 8532]ANW98839.1 phosphatidylglycerophosphate synthase [Thermoclostridium stercorarium subsp. thermolacticum DSM 2910]ANX01364.1 phosphatidylglycerophosphate synthase [Thermoclostridium stercorarium subsp. leptospartum DSM 9219]
MRKDVFDINSSNKWKYLPNILTILRLLVIPVMAYLMILGKWVPGLIVFLLAGLTDILDGYIARKFNVISNFGKLADPLADKLLQLTALLLLARGGRLPRYFFYILCAKELAMIIGSLFFLQKDVVVYSNWVGKTASAILFSGIVLSFLNMLVSVYLLWIGVVVSFTAGVNYLIKFLKKINENG